MTETVSTLSSPPGAVLFGDQVIRQLCLTQGFLRLLHLVITLHVRFIQGLPQGLLRGIELGQEHAEGGPLAAFVL